MYGGCPHNQSFADDEIEHLALETIGGAQAVWCIDVKEVFLDLQLHLLLGVIDLKCYIWLSFFL